MTHNNDNLFTQPLKSARVFSYTRMHNIYSSQAKPNYSNKIAYEASENNFVSFRARKSTGTKSFDIHVWELLAWLVGCAVADLFCCV